MRFLCVGAGSSVGEIVCVDAVIALIGQEGDASLASYRHRPDRGIHSGSRLLFSTEMP